MTEKPKNDDIEEKEKRKGKPRRRLARRVLQALSLLGVPISAFVAVDGLSQRAGAAEALQQVNETQVVQETVAEAVETTHQAREDVMRSELFYFSQEYDPAFNDFPDWVRNELIKRDSTYSGNLAELHALEQTSEYFNSINFVNNTLIDHPANLQSADEILRFSADISILMQLTESGGLVLSEEAQAQLQVLRNLTVQHLDWLRANPYSQAQARIDQWQSNDFFQDFTALSTDLSAVKVSLGTSISTNYDTLTSSIPEFGTLVTANQDLTVQLQAMERAVESLPDGDEKDSLNEALRVLNILQSWTMPVSADASAVEIAGYLGTNGMNNLETYDGNLPYHTTLRGSFAAPREDLDDNGLYVVENQITKMETALRELAALNQADLSAETRKMLGGAVATILSMLLLSLTTLSSMTDGLVKTGASSRNKAERTMRIYSKKISRLVRTVRSWIKRGKKTEIGLDIETTNNLTDRSESSIDRTVSITDEKAELKSQQ